MHQAGPVLELDAGMADAALDGPAPGEDVAPKLQLRVGVEASVGLLPSGYSPTDLSAGGLDVFVGARPMLGLVAGDVFSIELMPTFRFRLGDTPPLQDGSSPQARYDIGRVIRAADWDEASDFGQILQSLVIGRPSGVFWVRGGSVNKHSLGFGHLVSRYSNQSNPDYHPAAAWLAARMGPIRAEAFASDILGARLFAGALTWDIGETFSKDVNVAGRYHVNLELAGDVGLAGRPVSVPGVVLDAPGASLLHVEADAMLYRSRTVRLLLLGGFGTRLNSAADVGLVVGGAADLSIAEIGITLRAELRKQAGGFRHGYFGPTYELSRFAGMGFSGVALAHEQLPDSFSGFGEVRVGVGQLVSADVVFEIFGHGRLDADATVTVAALEGRVLVDARLTTIALAQSPRVHTQLGARVRVLPALYVLASGGLVFFPQPDGTLRRGVTAFAGVGVDFETKGE